MDNWFLMQEEAELARHEAIAAGERAQVLTELGLLDERPAESLRLKLARAFVNLGSRIHPEATAEIEAEKQPA